MMLKWRLEDIDFAIIGILIVILLLTFLWRHFFRWDTRYGLKQRGTDMETYRAFEPPFPRNDAPTIVVLEQYRPDPRCRGTWLVQGLLGAGFRVLLVRSAREVSRILGENRCVAMIHHDSSTRKGGLEFTTTFIRAAVAAAIPRAIFVNEGGTPGLKNILDSLASISKGKYTPAVQYSLISCSTSPLPDTWLARFHDALVLRRPKASLHDAELQAVGSVLKWVGNG